MKPKFLFVAQKNKNKPKDSRFERFPYLPGQHSQYAAHLWGAEDWLRGFPKAQKMHCNIKYI